MILCLEAVAELACVVHTAPEQQRCINANSIMHPDIVGLNITPDTLVRFILPDVIAELQKFCVLVVRESLVFQFVTIPALHHA